MELDIDIRLTKFPRKIALELGEHFPVEFKNAKTDEEGSPYCEIAVWAAAESQVVTNVDTGVRNFLQRLAAYTEIIKQSRGVLRLGIFYDLSETVVFPFRLSIETVKALGELNLSIDATGYPCADESSDSGSTDRGNHD